jgi:hypothetical protein
VILADTSIWIDHLNRSDATMEVRLQRGQISIHPFVRGEIALGNLRQRDLVLGLLADLPRTLVANDDEVLAIIGRHRLHGCGIGYVDAHLLAATLLSPDTELWTRDLKLHAAAAAAGVAVTAPGS